MADINVTINPAPSVSAQVSAAPEVDVTIGEGIPKHAVTHAPGGSDSLEAYYATTGSLAYVSGLTTGIGNTGYLTGYVAKSETGDFYPSSNPSGFITGVDLSGYVTGDVVRPSQTGDFVTNSQTGDFITSSQTGQFVSDSETGAFYPASNPSGFITGIDLSSYATQTYVTGVSGHLQQQVDNLNNATGGYVTGSVVRPTETGAFLTTGAADARYALSSATGNFVTTSQTGVFASQTYVNNASGYLQTQVTAINNQTGNFALKSQTGSFITTSQTGQFVGTGQTGYYTGIFYPYNSNPLGYVQGAVVRPSQTGQFVGDSETGAFLTTGAADTLYYTLADGQSVSGYAITGYNDAITGVTVVGDASKTITLYQRDGSTLTAEFVDASGSSSTGYLTGYVAKSETGEFYAASNPSGFITGVDLSGYVTGDVVRPSETGDFITTSQTGQFYAADNPSGFITGVDLSNYVTGDVVRPSETGNFVTTSETGDFVTTSQTGQFYPVSNPSGYITGVDLSAYVTGDVVRPSETGDFITTSQTGAFYPASNPSGFITGVDLSAYVTGDVVRPSETGDFITDSETGQFYAASNPSGFITGVDLSAYVTGDVVRPSETGAFLTTGAADERYALQSDTGNFITQSQTGQFYPNSNPSGFITGVDLSSYATTSYVTGVSGDLQNKIDTTSGYAVTGYNDSITGIEVTGNLTKTINLFQRDGGTLSASFTDASGEILQNVVYTTGDQNISGEKRFYNEAFFESGVHLSGKLTFNTGFLPEVFDGEASWNNEYGTVQIGMNNGDVVNPVGFKNFYRVKANASIAKGKVVMAVGTVGNSEFILAQEAANIGSSGELIMGVSAEAITAGNFGDVVSFGAVKGVDTSLFNSGAILYFDPASTGGFTETPPSPPNAKVITALNLDPSSNGTVFVRVDPGSVLGGSDSNVKFTALQDNDFISYHAASGFWRNKTLTTGDVSGINNYVLKSETGSFITTSQTGQFVGDSETGAFLTTGAADGRYALQSQTGDFITTSQTGQFVGDSETGNFITTSQTGAFYPASNPSGFITGVDLSAYVTGDVVRPSETGNFITTSQTGQFVGDSETGAFLTTGAGDGRYALQSETGSFITSSQTGEFYPTSNPSGYITGVDLSAYVTGDVVRPSETGAFLTTGAADSRYALQSATGDFITTSQTGAFAAAANTGAFLTTGAADNRYALQSATGDFITTSQTGVFYPTSNPSGYITGVDLSAYVTGSVVRPSETGDFITTSQTGQFVGDGETGVFLTTSTADGKYVSLTGDQTISGDKTFADKLIAKTGFFGTNNTYGNYNDQVIAGGVNNTVSGARASIGGGYLNIASGSLTNIAGGYNNIIYANYSNIAGGYENSISGTYSNIAGGFNNKIERKVGNIYSNIAGGANNTVSGFYSNIAGGLSNVVSGNYSHIGGGSNNINKGAWSNIGGGNVNQITTSGQASSIVGGYGAKADRYGIEAKSSYYFENIGDAQKIAFTLYADSYFSPDFSPAGGGSFLNIFAKENVSDGAALVTCQILGQDSNGGITQMMRKITIKITGGIQSIEHIESIGTDITNGGIVDIGILSNIFRLWVSSSEYRSRWIAHIYGVEIVLPPAYP